MLAAPVMSRQAFAYETGAGKMPHGVVVDPRVFVAIAPDGTVTILAHRSEMGTGVRTSLPLIVAEEMEADWSQGARCSRPMATRSSSATRTPTARAARGTI